jgi:hypothetical protein
MCRYVFKEVKEQRQTVRQAEQRERWGIPFWEWKGQAVGWQGGGRAAGSGRKRGSGKQTVAVGSRAAGREAGGRKWTARSGQREAK